MTGIVPDAANGGLIIRDGSGVCTPQAGVQQAYCPPPTFTSTCQLTALPSDCTARISAAQINALASELLCFMATINPNGSYNCGSVCNLASNFLAWAAANNNADEITITGDGSAANPYRIIPTGTVAAILADDAAGDNLASGLISTDAPNVLVQGTDGRLLVSPLQIVNQICANDAVGDALAACLLSTDPTNTLTVGTDGRLFGQTLPADTIMTCVQPATLVGYDAGGVPHRYQSARVNPVGVGGAFESNFEAFDPTVVGTQNGVPVVLNIVNPNPCHSLGVTLTFTYYADLRLEGNGEVRLGVANNDGFGGGSAVVGTPIKQTQNAGPTEIDNQAYIIYQRSTYGVIPPGGAAGPQSQIDFQVIAPYAGTSAAVQTQINYTGVPL